MTSSLRYSIPGKIEPKITPKTQCHFFLPDRPKNCIGMALCDFVTFQIVKQNLQHSRFFFSEIKNVYSRFKINGGIIAVLRFFLFMSNLAKQQIFSRNVSNVKQLIGSMGDMFFSYSRPPRPRSQINMTDCGLERFVFYWESVGKCRCSPHRKSLQGIILF